MSLVAVTQNNDDRSQTCGLPGCDNPITQPPAGGPPRKYCCSEHRKEARRVRYAARSVIIPEPPRPEDPAELIVSAVRSPGEAPRPAEAAPKDADVVLPSAVASARHRHAGKRRGTRTVIALVGVSAVVAAFIPGDGGKGLPSADHGRSPNHANGPQRLAAVDTTWVPRAKKALAQVNKDLAQIEQAERAAAAIPRDRWSARLRALMQRLEQRKADLLTLQTPLRTDLSLVEAYSQAAAGLAGTREELGLLNQARGSLQSLSGAARQQMAWILNGLESQAGRLTQQERDHQNTEQNLRTPAAQASSRPLPDLPDDVSALTHEVSDAIDASTPPPNPGPSPTHPGGGNPSSDRPSAGNPSSPGKSTHTAAPPHPHPSTPSTPSTHPKPHNPPTNETPPTTTTPPVQAAPPVQQTPVQAASDGGGGGGGTDVGTDASDASDSSASDAGSDGSDGGDGGGDGGDGGGGDGGE
jgi:hypothetical protein